MSTNSIFVMTSNANSPFDIARACNYACGQEVKQIDFVYTSTGKNFCFVHFAADISTHILVALKEMQRELHAANGKILIGVNTSGGLDRTKNDKIVQVFFTSKGTFYRTDTSLHVWNEFTRDWVRTETQFDPTETPDVEMEDDFAVPLTPQVTATRKLTQQQEINLLATEFCRALFV
jgi:hypothetical protein